MSQYAAKVGEYFRRSARPMGTEIRGAAGSMQCGTSIVFGADVRAQRVHKLGFRTFACPHIIAACNRVAEQLEGGPVQALRELRIDGLQAEFDIPVEKAGKLLILQDAVRACYTDYQARQAASG
jgi:NifU-like protein involved in Fe-S cluster formation